VVKNIAAQLRTIREIGQLGSLTPEAINQHLKVLVQ
jgi:hypothetical protein